MTTAPIFEHTVGSHSDDRGGDADARCSCQDTHTTHSDNLEDPMSELTIKDKVETILDKCIFTALNAEMHSTATSVSTEQIMQLIDSAITEAYKKGYIKGGIDEILRHDKARETVEAQLKNNTTKQENIDE